MKKKKRKAKKKKSAWKPPREWLRPVDPEQFKFCFSLMGAGASGQMPIPRPKPLRIEGFGDVTLNNTPMNRGLLAVTKHLHEVYPYEQPQRMAIPFRLMSFADFLAECFHGKHPEFEHFLRRNEDTTVDVNETLIEAAASAEFSATGFASQPLLAIAQKLFEADQERES